MRYFTNSYDDDYKKFYLDLQNNMNNEDLTIKSNLKFENNKINFISFSNFNLKNKERNHNYYLKYFLLNSETKDCIDYGKYSNSVKIFNNNDRFSVETKLNYYNMNGNYKKNKLYQYVFRFFYKPYSSCYNKNDFHFQFKFFPNENFLFTVGLERINFVYILPKRIVLGLSIGNMFKSYNFRSGYYIKYETDSNFISSQKVYCKVYDTKYTVLFEIDSNISQTNDDRKDVISSKEYTLYFINEINNNLQVGGSVSYDNMSDKCDIELMTILTTGNSTVNLNISNKNMIYNIKTILNDKLSYSITGKIGYSEYSLNDNINQEKNYYSSSFGIGVEINN